MSESVPRLGLRENFYCWFFLQHKTFQIQKNFAWTTSFVFYLENLIFHFVFPPLFTVNCHPFFFFLVKIFLGIHISWGTLITVVVGCWRSYFSLSMYEAWVSIEEGSRNRESRSGLRVEGNDYPVIYYERRDVSRIKNRARTYIHPGYSSDIHSEPDEGPTKEQVWTPGILHGHPLS